MNPIHSIVDSHHQKYKNSCSPSLIEILLKIHGLVGPDYYALQNKYKNTNVGLTHFRDQEIEGLMIRAHDVSKGQSFIDRLKELWREGQIVALYCQNSNDQCHGWLVDNVRDGQIYLLSKYSELGNGEGRMTANKNYLLEGPGSIQITDLIYGQIQSA